MHRDEVILDVNVQYDGDLDVALEAEIDAAVVPKSLATATASVSNMSFAGLLRLGTLPFSNKKM